MSATPPGPPGAPPPNIAQIILPPGMTLGQFFQLQQALITISICVAVGFALVLYDYFILLRDELSLYRNWNKVKGQSPAFYSFIILRYAGIIAVFPALFFTSIQSQYCQVAASVSQVGVILLTGSAGIIFCYRVFAIWKGNVIVGVLIGTFYFIMIGCWIATASGLKALNGPSAPFGSNCQMQPVPSWSPIGFASSVAFDTLILVLGLFKLRGHLMMSSRAGRQIYRDNIMYFVAVTATNIVVLIIQSLPKQYDLIKPTAIPFSSVITYSMGCRVFLNLRLFQKKEARSLEALPMSISIGGPSLNSGSSRTQAAFPFSTTSEKTLGSWGNTSATGSSHQSLVTKPGYLGEDEFEDVSMKTPAPPVPRLEPLRHQDSW